MEITLRIPKSVPKWKIEFWKVRQVPLELPKDKKYLFFCTFFIYHSICYGDNNICMRRCMRCYVSITIIMDHIQYDVIRHWTFLQIKTYWKVNSIRLGLILLCLRESSLTLPFLSEQTEYSRSNDLFATFKLRIKVLIKILNIKYVLFFKYVLEPCNPSWNRGLL